MREADAPAFWTMYGLPDRIDGLSFADIGCWEGFTVAEANRRGAASALGVDYCTGDAFNEHRSRVPFDFMQLDVFSEKFLHLPEFDLVLCAGVLYHTESPLALLIRLRKICRLGGWVFVESTVYADASGRPVMLFHPRAEFDDNPSNWWSPNESCLHELMGAAGFADVETTCRTVPGRICVKGRAASTPDNISRKVLPRRPSFMPDAGAGNRHS